VSSFSIVSIQIEVDVSQDDEVSQRCSHTGWL
jgi:hypothetical protein